MIREDIDFSKAVADAVDRAKGDDAISRGRVAVGVGFERIAPVDTVGDGGGEEEGGVSGQLDEVVGRGKKEEVMGVGGLKFHDLSLERALVLLERIAGSGNLLEVGIRGVRLLFGGELVDDVFKLCDIEVSVLGSSGWFNRSFHNVFLGISTL